jgi:hypothetical protein
MAGRGDRVVKLRGRPRPQCRIGQCHHEYCRECGHHCLGELPELAAAELADGQCHGQQ